MSATLINLIIQLIAGAVGGNAAGAAMKNFDLGTVGNTVAGALGGAGGGTLLTALLPVLQGKASGFTPLNKAWCRLTCERQMNRRSLLRGSAATPAAAALAPDLRVSRSDGSWTSLLVTKTN